MQHPGFGTQASVVHWRDHVWGVKEQRNLKFNHLMLPFPLSKSQNFTRRTQASGCSTQDSRFDLPQLPIRAGGAEAERGAGQEPIPQLSGVFQRHTLHTGSTQPQYMVSTPTCLPSGFCQPRNGGWLEDEEAGGRYTSTGLERRDAILLASSR